MELVADNMNEIYLLIVTKLLTKPDYIIINRKYQKVHELIDCGFTLTDTHQCFCTERDMNLSYLDGELEFYYSGSPFLKDIVKYSKFWANVSDDGRVINSNYGKLLFHDRNVHGYTQFEYAKQSLINNKESKKAVLTLYSPENAFPSNDNPCTMYLQFFIRGNKLHLYARMRSNDIWFGIPYDVPFFVSVQHLMKLALEVVYPDLEIGYYNHRAGSLHMYERNIERFKEISDNYIGNGYMLQGRLFSNHIQGELNKWLNQITI